MKSRFMLFALLGILFIALLAACSSGGGAQSAGGGSKSFNVGATEFAYSPNTFTAQAGDKLTFNLTNKGTVQHTLVIQSPDGSTELAKITTQPGETKTLEFTPKDAGTYPIVCDIAGHKEAGMTGTLSVK